MHRRLKDKYANKLTDLINFRKRMKADETTQDERNDHVFEINHMLNVYIMELEHRTRELERVVKTLTDISKSEALDALASQAQELKMGYE